MTTPTDDRTETATERPEPARSRKPLVVALTSVLVVSAIAATSVILATGGGKDSVPADSAAKTPAPAVVLHPADVITRLRQQGELAVTAVHPLDGDRLFVSEGLEATVTDPFDGTASTAVVATFVSVDARGAYLASLLALGGAIAVGTGDRPQDLWGVNLWGPVKPADGPALADKIARRLGGTIRSN